MCCRSLFRIAVFLLALRAGSVTAAPTPDSTHARVTKLLARSRSFQFADTALSRALVRQAWALAYRAGQDSLALEAEYQLVRLLILDPTPGPTFLPRLRSVRTRAQRLGQWDLEARTYRAEGFVYSRQQEYEGAARMLQAELRILHAHHEHAGLADTYRTLAYARYRQQRHGEALQLNMRSLRHARLSADSLQLPMTLREIGALYQDVGDYPMSLKYVRASRDAFARNQAPVMEAHMNVILAVSHEQLGQDSLWAYHARLALRQSRRLPPEATAEFRPVLYYCLGQLAVRQRRPHTALRYFRQAEPGLRLHPELDHLVFLLNGLAESYLLLGRPAAAQRYLSEASRLAQGPAYQAGLAKTEKTLAQLSEARGDYRMALVHERRATRVQDSLFTHRKNKQLAELRTRYASEQKEAKIKLLQRTAAAQQAEAGWQRRHRNLLAGALVVVGLLGAASYRRYRLQRRTSRLLRQAQQQERARNAELEQVQLQLRQSLDDKEVLLKEVHHRVKNNLQIVSSLLALQAQAQRALPPVQAALREGQNWVKSIALTHELLYQADDLARVDFGQFLDRFVPHLQRTFAVPTDRVQVQLHTVGVQFDTDTAVPLGLIVNELLSNAFKYACSDGRPGHIDLILEVDPVPGTYRLQVRDDGPGLPSGFTLARASSLGLRLVQSLARQLGGELHLPAPGQPGACFHVSFLESAALRQAA